ncbi:hypothetical protein ACHAWC_010807 [Mediolabrus comicus]
MGLILMSIVIFIVINNLAFIRWLSHHDETAVDFASVTQPQPQEAPPKAKATIAYAVTLTSCGLPKRFLGSATGATSVHGAAVLAHSIHLSSIRNFHESGSYYDYKLLAFVHPEAKHCTETFQKFGYEIQIRDTPFNVTDSDSAILRHFMPKTGCCGEKEYLKLYSYLQFDYPIVVQLDLDSLILKPMDHLFDVMLSEGGGGEEGDENDEGQQLERSARNKVSVMHNDPLPPLGSSINAFFTKDYAMVQPGTEYVGVQGGFIIVRPSQAAFDEYIQIVLSGDFTPDGWGGKHGGFWGDLQIQGIVSYFYDYKHPGTAVELNRCYYNVMADPPRKEEKYRLGKDDNTVGKCRDGREECQDCRDVPLDEIYSLHFTVCYKPWDCQISPELEGKTKEVCRKYHGEWYRIREDLEKARAKKSEYVPPKGRHMPEIFRGFCKREYQRGYIPAQ